MTVKEPCPLGKKTCDECEHYHEDFMGALLMGFLTYCDYNDPGEKNV